VATFEPVRSRLLKNGAHTVFDSSQIVGDIVDVLVVRSDYLLRYPKNFQTLVSAWFKTLNYMQSQPVEAASYLAPLSGLSVQDYRKASDGIRFPGYRENLESLSADTSALSTTAHKLQTIMRNQQLLKKTLSVDGLFDPYILQRMQP
jgi:NitT/TauT family transport system substrate-binding protein